VAHLKAGHGWSNAKEQTPVGSVLQFIWPVGECVCVFVGVCVFECSYMCLCTCMCMHVCGCVCCVCLHLHTDAGVEGGWSMSRVGLNRIYTHRIRPYSW